MDNVRWISLKNNGAFNVSIRINGGSKSFEESSFPVGQERTIDLANAVGKIADGDVVWLEAVVKLGKDNKASERFIYRKDSNKEACYSIKGTTLHNSLSFDGISEHYTKIAWPIRWISLKNSAGFNVSIRINGGSKSFESSSFPAGQERTVDLADAVGKIKNGDEVWLEAVVAGGYDQMAKERFIYNNTSLIEAQYTIKGTTINNTLSYNGAQNRYTKISEPIRWISLRNNAGFNVSIRINGSSTSFETSSFPLGQEQIVDLADTKGKIKDGDEVWLEAVVTSGSNNTAREHFTYRNFSNLKASYSITGATFNNDLSYKGITEYYTKISEPIRYISLKNNGGFNVSIRINGGSSSFESSSFPIAQERTIDLADAIGKIKDGDEVWLEAVVSGGNNNMAKEHFIYKKTSNLKANYTISGYTLDNTLSYNGTLNNIPETPEPPVTPPVTPEASPIRYISLKNNGGFVVSIRVKGGSESFNSSGFPLGQEQTVDLADATGIKDGDMVYLEAVVKAGKDNTAGERFIYKKESNKKACYSIKGTTLNNSLSYNGIEQSVEKTMYRFIRNYPEDREMGWSNELQGVCHDENNWFFAQNGNIWKFPLGHDLNETCKSENRAKGIYKNTYGHRLGDFDYYEEYLFVPVSEDGTPYIAVFRANDLSYVAKTCLTRFGKDFSSVHWCAINHGDLYTSDENVGNDFTENTSPVMVYSIDMERIKNKQDDFLDYKTFIRLYTSSGDRLTRKHVQGGCFDDKNHLHINNGEYTLKISGHNYANNDGGISVFSILEIPQTDPEPCYRAKRIAYSDQTKGFMYQFNKTGNEPAGITYWDLTNKNPAGKVCGCFHAIMSDNAGIGDDDFYFKHYERTSVNESYASQHVAKMGVIITTERFLQATYTEQVHEAKRRRENQELVAGLFNNRNIDYTIIENTPLSEIKNILNALYENSEETDMNYIYINCHGATSGLALGYSNDSSEEFISYYSLKNVLSNIKGKRVILIDSCHSGGATTLRDPKSFILTSALLDENAIGDSVLGGWATRYWVCGAGYDFLPGAEHDMEADANNDKKVTLLELYNYTNTKLNIYSRMQRCLLISDNPNEVIFE